jgi:FkbM family methyltransferase
MNLRNLKAAYLRGQIGKPEYINQMHELHKILFDYSSFLKETDIEKIEILDDSVVMTSRVGQVKIYCDEYDKRLVPLEILNFGSYEKNDFEIISRLLKKLASQSKLPINFFDIGANVGWYTLSLFKIFSNKVRFLAFEPIPVTFEKLKANIDLNKASVSLYNFGFSVQEQDLTFYYYPEGSVNASAANLSESEHVQEILCRVRKLDDFVSEECLTLDFIKCDVEGAELFVFQGGIDSIKKHKPVIFTEMLRKWSAKFNYNPNDIINLLLDLGYRCFVSKADRLVEFSRMDDNTVETNFFFLHSSKHADIVSDP